ncbi:methylenetetrahydrofolate--tRNA-(uracil(54)-C(5))-methyltransferase (FADH(2)-oxidizing) TrmFO [Chitinivibrio alkaliphilus]|uniref:Methylenetetrahydrofolate--tRNA-(uracil-5-)-methyltransferase TrmFO n=1 Tax=Chitinivibrio alkaliphilus ACht1 TaxID=1313304 RepID=U7DAA2_9BACT|nr:methylenetetrahydrofolate--tRNA-(uracil(54)-C(5))-methyltransferase (FADH(2)-oxidizing) TrmFO [Chitinivibrio alkaliphilus]ERP39324.1 tRNA (uracil-5-)-methyltransferase Gid [Chitinivibrio alkaliphilus ACht1]
MTASDARVAIIGAGLAGSEAALVLAEYGISVDLFEMRPHTMTEAHTSSKPAELVCSNSLKSMELPSAHALLKEELSLLESPLLEIAKMSAVPAGSALAVDRSLFSARVEERIRASSKITLHRKEIQRLPKGYDYTLIATGPLTSSSFSDYLQELFARDNFNFYDAIAPIIDAESIDMSKAFSASRWSDGPGDYINCPFTKKEYDQFYSALLEADEVKRHSFEDAAFFEACLPIEVVARRGYDTLRFGMMKPVGLDHPKTGEKFFAVCQLRQENVHGTAYNMVGFQTRMTFGEQDRVLRMIPGLEEAEFLRHGTIHRNSYLNSPDLLQRDLSFLEYPNLFLAGQLTGNEGYTESICTGHCAAQSIAGRIHNYSLDFPGNVTAIGGVLDHITTPPLKGRYTPTNINFSLLAPPGKKMRKAQRKAFYCDRSLKEMTVWKHEHGSFFKLRNHR